MEDASWQVEKQIEHLESQIYMDAKLNSSIRIDWYKGDKQLQRFKKMQKTFAPSPTVELQDVYISKHLYMQSGVKIFPTGAAALRSWSYNFES